MFLYLKIGEVEMKKLLLLAILIIAVEVQAGWVWCPSQACRGTQGVFLAYTFSSEGVGLCPSGTTCVT
jgi:hypothetical protein